MPANDFPVAKKIDPVYEIAGRWYRKVNASDGTQDATAIRARVVGADGTSKIGWFVPIELPATEAE